MKICIGCLKYLEEGDEYIEVFFNAIYYPDRILRGGRRLHGRRDDLRMIVDVHVDCFDWRRDILISWVHESTMFPGALYDLGRIVIQEYDGDDVVKYDPYGLRRDDPMRME